MKYRTLSAALAAAALLLSASPSFAAENKVDATHAATSKDKATPKNAKTQLVNINGASLKELKTLPGIGDAEAKKIIAGRPYATKAWLASHGILPPATYEALKYKIIAKQPYADAGKNAEIYRNMKKK